MREMQINVACRASLKKIDEDNFQRMIGRPYAPPSRMVLGGFIDPIYAPIVDPAYSPSKNVVVAMTRDAHHKYHLSPDSSVYVDWRPLNLDEESIEELRNHSSFLRMSAPIEAMVRQKPSPAFIALE